MPDQRVSDDFLLLSEKESSIIPRQETGHPVLQFFNVHGVITLLILDEHFVHDCQAGSIFHAAFDNIHKTLRKTN